MARCAMREPRTGCTVTLSAAKGLEFVDFRCFGHERQERCLSMTFTGMF